MLERPLRYLAILLSLFIAIGFTLFALDDIGRASTNSQNWLKGIEATSPSPAGERAREGRNSGVREAIDDVNDVLLKPFASLSVNAESRWAQRGVPTLLGLLVYGFMLGYLARYTKARPGSHPSPLHRTA